MVFRVHAHEGAVLLGGGEHVEQLLVIDPDAVVGHEHLQGGVARTHQLRHVVLECLLGRVGNDHVERVIDDRAALGRCVIFGDHLFKRHADMLGGKTNH